MLWQQAVVKDSKEWQPRGSELVHLVSINMIYAESHRQRGAGGGNPYTFLSFLSLVSKSWKSDREQAQVYLCSCACIPHIACHRAWQKAYKRFNCQRQTWSLEQQGDNLKVCVCYSAQGAFLMGLALPWWVLIDRHGSHAVWGIWIHWLQSYMTMINTKSNTYSPPWSS